MLNGIVYRSTGSWYEIKLDNGEFIKARIKGKFRTKQIRTTNPIAVGDFVEVTKNQSGEFVVSDIKERKNYIIRKSVNLSNNAFCFSFIGSPSDVCLYRIISMIYTHYLM